MFIIRTPGDWLRSTTKSERGEFNESFLAQTKYKTSPGPPEQNPDRCKKRETETFRRSEKFRPVLELTNATTFRAETGREFFFFAHKVRSDPESRLQQYFCFSFMARFRFFSSVHRGIEASSRAGRMMKCRSERASKAFSFASLKQTTCLC